jgi:hypothetical protein
MQNVSDSWKAVHEQQLLNESYIEISMEVSDPSALEDASASDNGSVEISNTNHVVSNVIKNIVLYGTLEQNLFILDGSRELIPDSDYGDTGYIGNSISDVNCGFDTLPVVDVIFSEIHTHVVRGITITWAQAYDEYAKSFTVTAYQDDTIVATQTVENNTSVVSVVTMDIENYNRICVEILKWCFPNRRPRIAEIFLGVKQSYQKSDITKYEHEINVDAIDSSVPMNRVAFSIDNIDNKYDPNNLTGMSKYLMERQKIVVKYGLKMPDDTIEYIKAGEFYLSEWESPQNGIEASFVARDMLEFMSAKYLKGLYSPSGSNLYDLAVSVLTEANLPLNDDGSVKWFIHPVLKNFSTVAPLPVCTLSECLQYIAQASACVIYCDRDGKLHLEPASSSEKSYKITNFNTISRPEISLQKPLKSISTKVYNYFVDNTSRVQLFSGTVTVNGTKEICITYSTTASNVSASVSGGTLVSANYYSNACYLTLTGSGDITVTVTGYAVQSSSSDYVLEAGTEGETQSVDNPLITSTSIATRVSEWVKNWLVNRKNITINEWRADPRLDATDIISVDNKYGTESVRMTSVKYSYTGSFKGSGEGRVI